MTKDELMPGTDVRFVCSSNQVVTGTVLKVKEGRRRYGLLWLKSMPAVSYLVSYRTEHICDITGNYVTNDSEWIEQDDVIEVRRTISYNKSNNRYE